MSLSRPPIRTIKRLLVVNRGEIASRIISSARELGIETFAVFTTGDSCHAAGAAHAIKLSSPADYLDVTVLLELVQKNDIDAVHPGYGFLSESAEFSLRMWEDAGAVVIGPGWETLSRTGDKLQARLLADECNIPVCPALQTPTDRVSDLEAFVAETGFPIMIKAVDGGGGRGLRLVRNAKTLESSFRRAVEESPSRQVFAEKAAIDGFYHIEVQVIGDGQGNARHLWERECSIQRRFQKVVEFAPSMCQDRQLIARIIEDALNMATKISYFSLGTFEFLANPISKEYFFLEVNPRLQVEHTITESITSTDIVRSQLLLSQGGSLDNIDLPPLIQGSSSLPKLKSIQLRITAEDPSNDWSLSVGKVQSFRFPNGNGIRVDTNLINDHAYVVSADFDSLVAKLIITASSWQAVVAKAARALQDISIVGIKTNIYMLRAIVAHPDFTAGNCHTTWLEDNQKDLLATAEQLSKQLSKSSASLELPQAPFLVPSASTVLFRKGDSFSIAATPINDNANVNKPTESNQPPQPYHIQLSRIMRNEFPSSFVAEGIWTPPGSKSPQAYSFNFSSTLSSASELSSNHRMGNASDPSHVIIPFCGKLVELLVEEGDIVKEGDIICVVQQMKMELEVRASSSGWASWALDAEIGEQVMEGTLVAILQSSAVRELKL